MTSDLGFCSHCGTRLHPAEIEGGHHASCPSCGRVQWRNPEPIAGMLVTAGDLVLLHRHSSHGGSSGSVALPTTPIQLGETAEAAAVRAVQEQCGLDAKVTGIVGRPHSSPDTATVTIVFRGELESPGGPVGRPVHGDWYTAERLPWVGTEPTTRTALRSLVGEGIGTAPAHPHEADPHLDLFSPTHTQIQYCRHCGDLLGQKAEAEGARSRCPSCGKVGRGAPAIAASFLAVNGGRVLLGRRAVRSRPGFGLWAGPAGYTELGESVEHSARRELFEETSLVGEVAGLISVYTTANHVEVAYFGSSTGEPRPSAEMSELAWFARSELPWGEMFDSCPLSVQKLADRGLLFG